MVNAELKKAYEEVEQRVKERTEELTLANQQLYDEILERKKAEEAVHKSEEYFRNIFEHAAVGKSITEMEENCGQIKHSGRYWATPNMSFQS